MSGTARTPRGYRPDQVDAFMAALSHDRGAAWERAALLTVLAGRMETESARLRETAAGLAPQEYDTLGERARHAFRLLREEALSVREVACHEARQRVARAEQEAAGVVRAARAAARVLCAGAEEEAARLLLAARAAAEDVRVGTRREVRELRGQALAALREARAHTAALPAAQEAEQAGRRAAAERAEGERESAAEVRLAERTARAEAGLAAARLALEEATVRARHRQDEARARAAEIVAGARLHEERTARETEHVLREHSEAWDEVQAQTSRVRDRLTELTGRAAAQ
ncbi:cellulose-binding protein [Streptomyces sp. NPDC058459]|uniref:cellulose-binding protein n=1 Tax=Streptomyces sp. NPDC058459 TaxID=3346508 RepID=UPI00365ED164